VGASADIAEATDAINRRQVDRIVDKVLDLLSPGDEAAVLGLSYKPQTHVVEVSTGVAVAQALSDKGVAVKVYDPTAMDEARRTLGSQVAYASTAAACVRDAAVTVIATAWPEFSELVGTDFAATNPLVIDCWRVLDPVATSDRVHVVQVGRAERTPVVAGEGT
jgi:UDPglucose 6-dehydrogenase